MAEEWLKVDPAHPFNSHEWWANKYNIQNMLLRQVKFPHKFRRVDYMEWIYSDRQRDAWARGREKMPPNVAWFGWIQTCSEEAFLRYLGAMFERELTGGRLIRYSDAGGYEIYLVNGYAMHETTQTKVYSGNSGPNIIGYDERRVRDPRRFLGIRGGDLGYSDEMWPDIILTED